MADGRPRGADPGPGDDGDSPAACCSAPRSAPRSPRSTPMRPDVIGLNCATGPAEMSEHLRHLGAALAAADLVPAQRRPAVGRRRPHALRPHARAARRVPRAASSPSSACRSSAAAAAPRPSTSRRRRRRAATSTPAAAHARRTSRGVTSIYSPGARSTRTPSFLIIGERTNANGSKKFREAMLAGDWDTLRRRWPSDQVKEGAHVLDVCVDYVGRDGTADMDEIASRFATQASVPLVLDSTEPQVHRGRPAVASAAGPSSTRPTSRTASRRARGSTASSRWPASTAPRSSACSSTRRARPATSSGRCGSPTASTTSPSTRYGLEPADLIFDALTLPARPPATTTCAGDAIDTHRGASGASRPRCPACHTTLGLSNVSFGLKPAARHVLNSVFLHECVQAGLDSAIVHAAQIMPLNRIPDEQREVCLDLIYDRRGTAGTLRRRRGYDPLQTLLEIFADVKAAEVEKEDRSRLAGRAAPQPAHHRRRPRRPRGRPRRGAGAGHARRSPSSTTCCSPA